MQTENRISVSSLGQSYHLGLAPVFSHHVPGTISSSIPPGALKKDERGKDLNGHKERAELADLDLKPLLLTQ